jgi:hypothetical protein
MDRLRNPFSTPSEAAFISYQLSLNKLREKSGKVNLKFFLHQGCALQQAQSKMNNGEGFCDQCGCDLSPPALTIFVILHELSHQELTICEHCRHGNMFCGHWVDDVGERGDFPGCDCVEQLRRQQNEQMQT